MNLYILQLVSRKHTDSFVSGRRADTFVFLMKLRSPSLTGTTIPSNILPVIFIQRFLTTIRSKDDVFLVNTDDDTKSLHDFIIEFDKHGIPCPFQNKLTEDTQILKSNVPVDCEYLLEGSRHRGKTRILPNEYVPIKFFVPIDSDIKHQIAKKYVTNVNSFQRGSVIWVVFSDGRKKKAVVEDTSDNEVKVYLDGNDVYIKKFSDKCLMFPFETKEDLFDRRNLPQFVVFQPQLQQYVDLVQPIPSVMLETMLDFLNTDQMRDAKILDEYLVNDVVRALYLRTFRNILYDDRKLEIKIKNHKTELTISAALKISEYPYANTSVDSNFNRMAFIFHELLSSNCSIIASQHVDKSKQRRLKTLHFLKPVTLRSKIINVYDNVHVYSDEDLESEKSTKVKGYQDYEYESDSEETNPDDPVPVQQHPFDTLFELFIQVCAKESMSTIVLYDFIHKAFKDVCTSILPKKMVFTIIDSCVLELSKQFRHEDITQIVKKGHFATLLFSYCVIHIQCQPESRLSKVWKFKPTKVNSNSWHIGGYPIESKDSEQSYGLIEYFVQYTAERDVVVNPDLMRKQIAIILQSNTFCKQKLGKALDLRNSMHDISKDWPQFRPSKSLESKEPLLLVSRDRVNTCCFRTNKLNNIKVDTRTKQDKIKKRETFISVFKTWLEENQDYEDITLKSTRIIESIEEYISDELPKLFVKKSVNFINDMNNKEEDLQNFRNFMIQDFATIVGRSKYNYNSGNNYSYKAYMTQEDRDMCVRIRLNDEYVKSLSSAKDLRFSYDAPSNIRLFDDCISNDENIVLEIFKYLLTKSVSNNSKVDEKNIMPTITTNITDVLLARCETAARSIQSLKDIFETEREKSKTKKQQEVSQMDNFTKEHRLFFESIHGKRNVKLKSKDNDDDYRMRDDDFESNGADE